MENPGFLKKKYDLHTAPEVESAARRTQARTGEKVPQDPAELIQNYLDRLERLALDPDKEQKRRMFGGESRPRALSLLREMVMNKYVRPNREKMAQGAARVEERAARERGIEVTYGEQELEQRGGIAVEDLEKSLDNWISYLSDANEPYPVWFRYYAFRNILDLGDYDKDKGEFTKRSQGSTRLFPEIDRGALAYVQEMMEASREPTMLERLRSAQKTLGTPEDHLITKEKALNFANRSFAKQYAEGIGQSGEITPEMRRETVGKWVRYQQGTDSTALWASLQNKGTAWCTKGFATAETQLKGGDFYVYYTNDRQGKATIPRIAIRMEGDTKIAENPRGVFDSQQNLEPNMVEILDEKLKDFGPEADIFKKKSQDMRALTAIEAKTAKGQELTKDDLVLLYELDGPIEGFGYSRDPRIAEIRDQRNPREDAPIVMDCRPEQIAWRKEEIGPDTKAYIGSLFAGIFESDIEHIATGFPEGQIRKIESTIGGKTKKQLEGEMKERKIQVDDYTQSMLDSNDFTVAKNAERLNLVRLTVNDLGFPRGATTKEIYDKAQELGLDLCPAEVGPHLRLQYADQPLGEWVYIAMKPIADRDGNPHVFKLERYEDGLWLSRRWAGPGSRWHADYRLVFCLRK